MTAPLREASRRAVLEEADAAARQKWIGAHGRSDVHLSVVVPAYNERERLPPMLTDLARYLLERARTTPTFSYEVLVVDDGSSDGTSEVAATLGASLLGDRLSVVRLERNRGKGGAVKEGVLRASGEWVLVVDADGATRIDDHSRLEDEATKTGAVVAVGSRDRRGRRTSRASEVSLERSTASRGRRRRPVARNDSSRP